MFSWDDFQTFAWAFFVVLPITAVIHAAGHLFFVFLFGGKAEMIVGRGKRLFKIGTFSFHSLYFMDSFCHYETIENEKRWKLALIYAGGILFNGLTILIINFLIQIGILPKDSFFYQLGYFSVYFIFFALLPIDFGKDNPSDAKAIYKALKYGEKYKDFD